MNSVDPEIYIVPEAKDIAKPLFESEDAYKEFRERFSEAVKHRKAAYSNLTKTKLLP